MRRDCLQDALTSDDAASAVEYAGMLTLIVITCLVSLRQLGAAVAAVFESLMPYL